MKIASSPTPETEVFVMLGTFERFAPSNIFSFCIETVTVTLDWPVAFQLHPVLAMGEPGPTLEPTTLLT